jgi:hypothetical protein
MEMLKQTPQYITPIDLAVLFFVKTIGMFFRYVIFEMKKEKRKLHKSLHTTNIEVGNDKSKNKLFATCVNFLKNSAISILV